MNKQITDDYCSFEIAKNLKEKGFDWQQSQFYSEQDMDEWRQENSYQIPNPDYDPNIPFDTETITMVAPHISQSLALKWLREVHNIHIEIRYLPNQFTDEPSYKAMIWDMSEEIGRPLPNDIEFAFYETCVNKALKHTLENLI